MDGHRFDAFVKALAARRSRRRVLAGTLAAASGPWLSRLKPVSLAAQEGPSIQPSDGSAERDAVHRTPTPSVLEYFALGDSIAAGHGLGDDDGPAPSLIPRGYDGGTCKDCDGPSCVHCDIDGCGSCRDPGCSPFNPWCDREHCGPCKQEADPKDRCRPCCRRSDRSYPARARGLLAKQFAEVRFHHLACTGATSLTPARLEADRLPPVVMENGPVGHRTPLRLLRTQVDRVLDKLKGAPADRPVLVSITIGANDFEFASLELINRLYFSLEDDFDRWAQFRALEVKTEVAREVRRLLADKRVAVVLTEVHNPFNEASVFFTGKNTCLDQKCYDRVDRAAGWLNTGLRAVVNDAKTDPRLDAAGRIGIARIHKDFDKRKSPRPTCGDAGPDVKGPDGKLTTWIQYRNDPASTSFAVPDAVGLSRIARQIPLLPADLSLIDLVVRRLQQGEWRGDCFHPNDEGATYIARRVASVARPLLNGIAARLAAGILAYVSPPPDGYHGDVRVVSLVDDAKPLVIGGPANDPAWSLDGRRFAFVTQGASSDGIVGDQIEVADADGSNRRVVVPPRNNGYAASRGEKGSTVFRSVRWSPDGSALYYHSGWAMRGAEFMNRVDLATGVDAEADTGEVLPSGFDIAPDGTFALMASPVSGDVATWHLYLFREGSAPQLLRALPRGASWGRPAWSPDGAQIAFMDDGLRVIGRTGGGEQVLTDAQAESVSWTPDGSALIYDRNDASPSGPATSTIWTVPAAGGSPCLLFAGSSPAVRPDGSVVQGSTAAGDCTLEIHAVLCPAGYDGDDLFGTCHGAGQARVYFEVRTPNVPPQRTLTRVDRSPGPGIAVFEGLPPETYWVNRFDPRTDGRQVVYCSTDDGATVLANVAAPMNSRLELELPAGKHVVCDWYTIPSACWAFGRPCEADADCCPGEGCPASGDCGTCQSDEDCAEGGICCASLNPICAASCHDVAGQ
ncbi:MAG TPA: SGNH/GDSL hydrolase family protein [Thermomicrobiales bacterium]